MYMLIKSRGAGDLPAEGLDWGGDLPASDVSHLPQRIPIEDDQNSKHHFTRSTKVTRASKMERFYTVKHTVKVNALIIIR
ncbi:hypothetical protein PVL29_000979 [Vitis rotundifolia]|uniref:Uncharacterized protein n=1 Tax=Vitis rotundifolia TaxID=103349 RepID=A0AA39AKE6_VITRO|nr:hypothetical protein PVL29_000979 [Vitis rotundifolia]